MYLSGDFLLHAMCWNLSGLTPDEESALLAPSWRLSRRSVGGESLTRHVLESLSLFFLSVFVCPVDQYYV